MKKTTQDFPGLEKIKYWVFDLDNTLYPHQADLFTQVDHKMGLFIQDMFDVSYEEAKQRQKNFFRKHGTTLRGLMTEHGIEPYDYLNFVHDIDFSVLEVDKILSEAVDKLPGEKFIYTNASTSYAQDVLSRIGLSGKFKDIFDIHDAKFLPKPDMRSYHKMVDKFAIDPKSSVMVEDIAGNLNPAAKLGMTTVWVPTDTVWSENDIAQENIHHVTENLPQWLAGIAKQLD
tara:strand:+ start:42267 stop:42956 length:690 start_codon:yes stop_codon:yes gene_type:complete